MITGDNLSTLAQYGNTDVIRAYATRLLETRRLLATLTKFAHNGPDDPHKVNWCHVGDLGHLNDDLRETMRFLGVE